MKHVIGVSSGTSALRLALEAARVGPGHEVITTANTYIASCEAVSHAGASVRVRGGAKIDHDSARERRIVAE